MLLKCVPHVQHNYFFLIQPIRSLFSGAVFAVAFVLAKNSLINAMKRWLGAGKSYVNGNVKSVARLPWNFTVATQSKTFYLREMLVEYYKSFYA